MAARPFRLFGGSGDEVAAAFGKLEQRVLEALWRRATEASVRDLQADFPGTAYTTLMTTLDRLHRKGVLERIRAGRAFLYRPRYAPGELRAHLAERTLARLLADDRSALRPVLSFFVDAVSRRDDDLLDELETLVREKRKASQKEEPS